MIDLSGWESDLVFAYSQPDFFNIFIFIFHEKHHF